MRTTSRVICWELEAENWRTPEVNCPHGADPAYNGQSGSREGTENPQGPNREGEDARTSETGRRAGGLKERDAIGE